MADGLDPARLAAAVSALAARVTQPEVRTQLHALGAILPSVIPEPIDERERSDVRAALAAAMRDGDEPAAIAAMRRLAALERARVKPVDWSVASRG